MKGEKKTELGKTGLKKLQDLPKYKQYSNYFMGGVLALALVIVAIRYRTAQADNARLAAQNSLSAASEYLSRLRQSASLFEFGYNDAAIAHQRDNAYDDGIHVAQSALDSDDEPIVAAALVCIGDLNFEMANMPAIPGAATQPSLQTRDTPAKLLTMAEDSYNRVLNEHAGNIPQVTAARFGLAAIAEDRAVSDSSNWAKVQSYYQAIIDSGAGQVFKDLAKQRLDAIPDLRKPLVINLTTEPSSRAVEQVGPLSPAPSAASSQPSVSPTTIPSTQP